MGAVGMCGGTLSCGVPVHSHYYNVFAREGLECGKLLDEVYRNRSQLQLARGIRTGDVIDARARVSYYYAFGVLPDEQLVIENYYHRLLKLDYDTSVVERSQLVLEPGLNVLKEI